MSEITLPSTQATTAVTLSKEVAAALPRLQLGQLLQATVLSAQGGKAELQLPQGTLTAHTQVPLKAGEQLKLTVAQLQPQVTLTLDKPASPPLDQLGQKVYPKQLPLQEALQNMAQLAQSATSGKGAQVAVQQLIQQLPTLMQLFNPKEVKAQIGRSGTFMENHLLQQPAALKGDLKQQLLQMKAQLSNQPAEQKLLKQLDAMIARIELNQMKSLQQGASGQTNTSATETTSKETGQSRSWQVEIPFMVEDEPQQLLIKCRQQGDTEAPESMRWHIELQLNPPDVGPIEVHAIHHQGKLDVHFITEREETSLQISDQLEKLEASLSTSGITTGTLFSRQKSVNDPTIRPLSTGFSIKV